MNDEMHHDHRNTKGKAKRIMRNVGLFIYLNFFLASFGKVSKVALTVKIADNLSEGRHIDAEYSSYFDDENNTQLKVSISNPDYDVTADPLAKAQWMGDMFEEENFGEFVRFQNDWKTGHSHLCSKSGTEQDQNSVQP